MSQYPLRGPLVLESVAGWMEDKVTKRTYRPPSTIEMPPTRKRVVAFMALHAMPLPDHPIRGRSNQSAPSRPGTDFRT